MRFNPFETGCIDAGEKWLEHNLIPVAGVAVGVALMQVGFLAFAHYIGFRIITV